MAFRFLTTALAVLTVSFGTYGANFLSTIKWLSDAVIFLRTLCLTKEGYKV